MILQASFKELNDIISEKTTLKGLSLAYSDTDTASVSFQLNILGLTPSIKGKVKILSIEGSKITAEVDAGSMGAFILDKAKKLVMEKTPEGLFESFDGKLAILDLDAIPELKSVFEAITVDGLSFTEEAVCLDASLK